VSNCCYCKVGTTTAAAIVDGQNRLFALLDSACNTVLCIAYCLQLLCVVYSLHCVSAVHSHNVLIKNDLSAVLTDFGMSKTATTFSGMTTTRSAFGGGTISWSAPELFDSRHNAPAFSSKCDVYSFGIVVWEVLCGFNDNLPWAGLSFVQILTAVTQGQRPDVQVKFVNDNNVAHAHLLADIMAECLQGNPFFRPSFIDIDQHLQRVSVPAQSA
jgi:serine/threonine protein kinase